MDEIAMEKLPYDRARAERIYDEMLKAHGLEEAA